MLCYSESKSDPVEMSSYLGVCDEQTVGVLVFTGDLILRQHVSQLLDEGDHFLVPGDVSHGQTAGRAFSTVCHSLHTCTDVIGHKRQEKKRIRLYNSFTREKEISGLCLHRRGLTCTGF